MPQFNTYPALQARTFDIQDIQRQSLHNQLLQSKLQQAQGEVQRQGQLREIMPGVGAEAGLGPNAQQALAIDPSQLSALMKIPKAERDRAKERAATLGNLALGVLTAPPVQRAATWSQARESAIASGANPENVPETYDQGTEQKLRLWVAQADKIRTLLDQVPDEPSGYQRTEGGLEFTPGGPADPAQAGRLAAAKRGPDGGATAAQQANNAEINAARQTLDRMGLDKAEILRRTQKATNTGRANPDYDPSLERLLRTATQRKVGADPEFAVIHRRYLGPAPEFSDPAGMRQLPPGTNVEEPGVFDRIGDFLFGDDGDTRGPAPGGPENTARRGPRRGMPRPGGRGGTRGRGGAKAIPAMNAAEIKDLVDTQGESLTPAERKAIQARLDALGM